jgi:hypothetical protein
VEAVVAVALVAVALVAVALVAVAVAAVAAAVLSFRQRLNDGGWTPLAWKNFTAMSPFPSCGPGGTVGTTSPN